MVRQKQVCIIGAGVSGLAAAKAFAARGHRITIIERSGDLGGVWEPARSYPEVQTQSPKDLYRYTDKAMPDSYPEWPKGPQVHAYLTEYAKDNDLLAPSASTRPWCRWIAARFAAGLAARAAGGRMAASRHEDFDFVAVCTGQFNEPQTLSLPGEDSLQGAGRAHHALLAIQRSRPSPKARKIVVLGGSKSATDIAVNAVNSGAREVTLVYREPVWRIPYFIGGLVNFKRILYIRAQEEMFRELGHRRDVAVRACGRKAVGLGQLARAGEPAESSAQARQVRHGAERADRGRRQLLGADRNARNSFRWSPTAASRLSAAASIATTAIPS